MSATPRLGPVALCTLIARDGAALQQAYCKYLHQRVCASGPLDDITASTLGYPDLAGQPSWTLANQAGRTWLHIIEHPGADDRAALNSHGWLSMEILVEDVDALAASLADSPFTLLRPPADLDVSDKIRACQAEGPAGEILYLTQVRGEVPPFQLPTCQAPVDHLFIPVLSTPSRESSLAGYAAISGNDGMSFDTKITVVNQARGFDLDRRHPVATLQLAGEAMIEIDEIAETQPAPAGICQGVACVTFHCTGAAPDNALRPAEGPLAGSATTTHVGVAGEHYALTYP